jgi:hypothetical protein
METIREVMLLLVVIVYSNARINASTGLHKSFDSKTHFYINKDLSRQTNVNHDTNAVLSFNSVNDKQDYRFKVDEDEQNNHSPIASNDSTASWIYGSFGLYIIIIILYFILLKQKSERDKQ